MFTRVNIRVKEATFIHLSLAATMFFPALDRVKLGENLGHFGQAIAISQVEAPFTSQERTQISKKFFTNPQVAQSLRGQRVRLLSLVNAAIDKESRTSTPGKHIASLLLFNYSTGKATRYLVEASNGRVLKEEQLPGRPSASPEEVQEAIRIIRANPELARLLRSGSVLEGGFIVDGPQGARSEDRFIQMQVLTPDRRSLQRVVTVDLTSSTIASSKSQY